MTNFLINQLNDFNFLQFAAILFFVVTFQKSNTTKLLDKQTSELHASIKELKEEIHWSVQNVIK
jgi:gas vesicle protein